mgnify:CR=1 FL=1
MKNKGFTLIELLAVIVILSVITLITIPMITNVIEESKKKALASSIQGLVESANLYAIENDGVYEFLFDKEHKGSTKKGESLDYRGTIDGEGKLYLDKEGNVSVCISNDKYYVYKNYNSGIIVGNKKTGNCIIGFDSLTNKYVAMLDNGTGNVSNVYSKDEVNNLVDEKATELNNKITNNTNEITNMKSNIEELQNNLNNYALQSELNKTNSNLNNLSGIVGNNTNRINTLESGKISYSFNPLDNGTTTSCTSGTAEWAKEYFSLMPSNTIKLVYNYCGVEYTFIFSKKQGSDNNIYGSILRFGYSKVGIDMLRISKSTWMSNDWESI